jgi:peptidoglycan/LPS O-acetylase OafA/YrhL
MAKKKTGHISENFVIDRFMLIGILLAGASYIVRGWPGMFFEAGAIVIGIMWSYRAIMTNPHKEFRLLAALVLVLLGCLLTFYLAAAHALLHSVKY